jgi:hypothetical protein
MNLRDKLSLLQEISCVVFVSAIVLLCWKRTYSGHGYFEGLSGPSFSDPSQTIEMSKSWKFNGNELIGEPA